MILIISYCSLKFVEIQIPFKALYHSVALVLLLKVSSKEVPSLHKMRPLWSSLLNFILELVRLIALFGESEMLTYLKDKKTQINNPYSIINKKVFLKGMNPLS